MGCSFEPKMCKSRVCVWQQGKMSSFAVDFKLEKVNSDFYSAIQEKKSKSLVKGITPHMCHYSDLRSDKFSLLADILL
jgi:hypothetical protein